MKEKQNEKRLWVFVAVVVCFFSLVCFFFFFFSQQPRIISKPIKDCVMLMILREILLIVICD